MLAELRGTRCAVSRAASPWLTAQLDSPHMIRLPVSGGRTVWAAAPADTVVVVETPNHLGLEEALPPGEAWVGIRRSTQTPAHENLVDALQETGVAHKAVERLAKRLATAKGVSNYHRAIRGPWFTLLAVDPAMLEQRSSSVGVEVLGRAFPDVPGGVRLEVMPDATVGDVDAYAAAVEAAIATRNTARA